MDELREKIARAAYSATPRNKPYDLLTAFKRHKLLSEADAALSAIEAAGYAVVPREPTEWMTVVGDERIIKHLNSSEVRLASPTPAENCYKAMIDAASRGE